MEIILEKSRQARPFSLEESFFEEEFERVADIIRRLVESKGNSNFHVHEAIGIFGERGLGKTSFLLSIEHLLNTEDEYKYLGKKLCFLPILDPTLLEETEFFLVTLISAICDKVHRVWKSRCSECSDYNDQHKNEGAHKDWEKSLRGLANHLVAVEGLGYETNLRELAGSPDIFAQEALMRGHSGKKLADAFHEFVSSTIKFLKNYQSDIKALVIRLDDIDAAFGKGWPVLETIRKYLTTPGLIVIASGDFELFQMVVHLEHIRRIRPNENGLTYDQINEKFPILKETEKQYLGKLFPLKNQIHMISPRYKIIDKDFEGRREKQQDFAFVKETENSEKHPLSKIFKEFSEDIFCPDYWKNYFFQDWNPIAKIIPSTSRELVRFIDHVLREYLPKKGSNEKERKQRVIDHLIDFTAPHLYDYGINPQKLKEAVFQFRERWLFQSLTSSKTGKKSLDIWQRGYCLEADYPTLEQNRVILAIQAAFNHAYRNYPPRITECWLTLAAPWLNASEVISDDRDKLNTYLSYIRYDSSEEPVDMYAWDICYRYQKEGIKSIEPVGPGFCIIDEFTVPNKLSPEARFCYDLCSFYIETGQSSLRHLSFIYGLACLNEALTLRNLVPILKPKDLSDSKNTDDEIDKNMISYTLKLFLQARHYPVLTPGHPVFMEKPAETSEPSLIFSDPETIESWSVKINEWRNLYENIELNLAVPDLADTWKRFHHDLYKQKNSLSEDSKNAGEILRLSALAFLHSILVQDSRAMGYGVVINFGDLGADGFDDNILSKNLDAIEKRNKEKEEDKKDLTLFMIWAMCPLIWSLLNDKDRCLLKRKLKTVCSPDSSYFEGLKNIKSVYKELSGIKTESFFKRGESSYSSFYNEETRVRIYAHEVKIVTTHDLNTKAKTEV